MKKVISLLLATLMIVSVLASCSKPATEEKKPEATKAADAKATRAEEKKETKKEEKKDAPKAGANTLILREGGDPQSFVPSASADDNAYAMFQNMFNRLTKLDASKQPVPDAAEKWDVSADGKKITFHLKKNMKWHDGKDLTSADVKYTFDYIKANKDCYFSSSMDIVDSIEAPDALTAIFNLNKADMSFIARIGWYATFIMPKHIFDNGKPWLENDAAKKPVGSGPFMFSEYKQGVSTTLVKNPNYHDGAPKLDKLVFTIIPDNATAVQAFKNGEIDILGMVPTANIDEFKADKKVRMDRNVYPSPYRWLFNISAEKVKDVAVRRAIAYCVDRKEISNKVYAGVMPPEFSAYPSVVEWAANTETKYPDIDLAKAAKILEDAGYKKDADGFYVRGITVDVFQGMEDMNKLLVASCAKAGIEITMNLMEFNAWAEKVTKKQDFMIECQGGFMGPDPAALYSRYGSKSVGNYTRWANAKFDELCEKGASEPDQAKRAKYYKDAQALIIEDMIQINFVGWAAYEAARADLENLPIDGAGKWGWNEYTFTSFKK